MAGGEGTRLRPMTANQPKPLLPVVNKPIMEHVLRLLKRHGFTETVVTVQFLASLVRNYFGDGEDVGMSLQYATEDMPLGTAGSVKNAEDELRASPFLVISGDALTDIDLSAMVSYHKKNGALVTVALSRVPNPLEFGIIIVGEDGRIQRFLEKPTWGQVFSDTVNTGIYVMEPEVLAEVPAGVSVDGSGDVFPQRLKAGAPLYGWIADVLPVAIRDIAVQRGVPLEQLGEHVTGPVDHPAGRDLAEHLGLHDVHPGVDRVGEHLAPGRLLEEPLDPPVLLGDHDAEFERVGHPGQPDGDQRALVLVEVDHRGQVHVGQRVAGDDQEGLVTQRVLGVPDAARGTERHLLGGVLQAHAEFLAVAEVVADQRGQELDGDDGLGEAVPLEQPQDVLHDGPVGHGKHGLGLVGGHRPQPCPFPACHDDGLQRFGPSSPGFRIPSLADSRCRTATLRD